MDTGSDSHRDGGFTLIELLVAIVILGVLATVVVFAVGGIVDRGEVSALEGDARTLQSAEESHYAIHGTYASETELVSAGLLRDESRLHDITVVGDGEDYTIAEASPPSATTTVPDGGGDGGDGDGSPLPPDETTTTTTVAPGPGEPGGPPLQAVAASLAGQSGWSYGSTSSPKTLVIIGNGSGAAGQALWQQITSAGTALRVDTQVIWMDQVSTRAEVDAILASAWTYIIVPIQVPLSGGGYAGQYINGRGYSSPGQYWWGQQQGGVSGAIAHYIANF